ncbi:N-acetyl-1-D-myo-inositol-2-amino-2-deoxy-alpha-D-glucopyranoside deacetylase [Candidatus Chlorohelix sp.]|uniref:N-acetyl-1-D-myo-inositol-2-amino-2-deoxy-alpha- D-glucopyranoside deacetylase n=1 Tax=Candidatus Chlorohelix sp. TaxID=3139201 RepID=UPI003071BD83
MADNIPLTFMAVHAHPDDEVFSTGGTLARLSAEGVRTVLVTATRGEAGDIVDPTLDEATRLEVAANLGKVREGELREAVAILGISELRFLDFRDSGMVGSEPNANPESFYQANFDDAVKRLVKYIREFRPQVVTTYNQWGGYGHPDHVQAHRVTVIAFNAAGDKRFYPDLGLEAWQPSKLYYTALPISMFRLAAERARSMGIDGPWSNPEMDFESMGDPDATVTTRYDAREYFDQKLKAFSAHKTQISPDSMWYKMPPEMLKEGMGYEYYHLAQGKSGVIGSENMEIEDDLFAGIR